PCRCRSCSIRERDARTSSRLYRMKPSCPNVCIMPSLRARWRSILSAEGLSSSTTSTTSNSSRRPWYITRVDNPSPASSTIRALADMHAFQQRRDLTHVARLHPVALTELVVVDQDLPQKIEVALHVGPEVVR